jgi:hypothetical protein
MELSAILFITMFPVVFWGIFAMFRARPQLSNTSR